MTIKSNIVEIDIESVERGYLVLNRYNENDSIWLTIYGDKDFPFIIENTKDIDDLCKLLQDYKKLLK